ncbi:hypothetical protein PV415_36765 [Streptomyces sp. ME03-5684b]|uniref:hypothetical protein n=1 Tax=Streptomyces sp. ME03-5684b TaxID=3028681 RepID=UPI0029B61E66|nr:hypothetical protein [Streptomyces sp. ME03-5684b]MDX3322456.1 hypothetical protein [Streptomyces sp. ME03-5684b]
MHSPLRFTAWFKDPAADAGPDDVVSQPVVGWRESDGAAMVLQATDGRVVPAAEQEGFVEIEQLPDEVPLGVVPGNGWRVTQAGQGPVRESAHTPVAFVVYATHVVPVTSLPPGGDFKGSWRSSNWRLLPPGE